MRLRDVVESVRVKLEPALADAGMEAVEYRLGQQHVPEVREDSPRVVWVPRGGNVSFSRQATPYASATNPDSDNPIFIGTRETVVDVYLWNDGIDETEKLLGHFVAALHAAMAGAWAPVSERWILWHPVLEADAAAGAWVMGTEASKEVRMLCVFSFGLNLDLNAEPVGEVPHPVGANVTGSFVHS